MRYGRFVFLTALIAAALAGCASGPVAPSAKLTYETTPEGAALYEGGQAIGTAPITRTYAGDGKSDTIRTPLVTAVWPSGAKESYYTLVPPGSDRVANIARPANAPGLQADLDNARSSWPPKSRRPGVSRKRKRATWPAVRPVARRSKPATQRPSLTIALDRAKVTPDQPALLRQVMNPFNVKRPRSGSATMRVGSPTSAE